MDTLDKRCEITFIQKHGHRIYRHESLLPWLKGASHFMIHAFGELTVVYNDESESYLYWSATRQCWATDKVSNESPQE